MLACAGLLTLEAVKLNDDSDCGGRYDLESRENSRRFAIRCNDPLWRSAFAQTADLAGEYANIGHEDAMERAGGPPLGDYMESINRSRPNEGRVNDEAIRGLPEFSQAASRSLPMARRRAFRSARKLIR